MSSHGGILGVDRSDFSRFIVSSGSVGSGPLPLNFSNGSLALDPATGPLVTPGHDDFQGRFYTVDVATGDRTFDHVATSNGEFTYSTRVLLDVERRTMLMGSRIPGGAVYEVGLEGGVPVLIAR